MKTLMFAGCFGFSATLKETSANREQIVRTGQNPALPDADTLLCRHAGVFGARGLVHACLSACGAKDYSAVTITTYARESA